MQTCSRTLEAARGAVHDGDGPLPIATPPVRGRRRAFDTVRGSVPTCDRRRSLASESVRVGADVVQLATVPSAICEEHLHCLRGTWEARPA